MKPTLKKPITYLFSFAILILALSACKKDNGLQPLTYSNNQTDTSTLSLATVQTWYDSPLKTNSITSKHFNIDWSKAQNIYQKNKNWWLADLPGQPTYKNVKQGYRKITFLKDSSSTLKARILEIIPDTYYYLRKQKAETKDFTGRVFIYDDSYHLLGGKIYNGGKQIGKIQPDPAPKVKTQMVQVSESCDWYDSSYIDAEGVFTIHSEQICDYMIYDDGFYPDMEGGGGGYPSGDPLGGGGGGGAASPAPAPPPQIEELPMASNPAISPKDYMKCFGNIPDAGATMTVTIYVQEPQPGTSFPLGTNGVGHAAIGLSKSGGGQTITQVVGYYPVSTSAVLGGASKVVDNHDMNYNASITYSVSAMQFSLISMYIATPPSTYDIYNFNCTNFAISACQQGGIALPSADTIVGLNGVGGWAHAATPGGLGDSLGAMNGQSNVNNNGGSMPKSHGACN
ncbi:MAG: hypothetical protein V4592_08350 [Bacteroidota bacterium]